MERWFRVYDGLPDDPKVQRLSDALFRAWINLLCLASRYSGEIPKDHGLIAFALRLTVIKVEAIIFALVSATLLEETETGYRPHNWNGRQYKSDVSTVRVKQFRERQRNVSSAVSETPTETVLERPQKTEDREQKTETENKKEQERASARRVRRHKTVIPDNFPDDEARRRAQETWSKKGRPDLAASVLEEMAAFRDHHISHGKTSADWAASWRTWIKNAPGFTPQERANGRDHKSGEKRTATDGHLDAIASLINEISDRKVASGN